MVLNEFPTLLLLTLRSPREGADAVLRLKLPSQIVWQLLVLVSIVSTFFAWLGHVLFEQLVGGPTMFADRPFAFTTIQLVTSIGMILAIHYIGRVCGGTGSFIASLTLITWLQIVITTGQILQFAIFAIFPLFSALLVLIVGLLFFVLITVFVQVIHGFQSAALTFFMIVASAFGLMFVFAIFLTVTGLVDPAMLEVQP